MCSPDVAGEEAHGRRIDFVDIREYLKREEQKDLT